MNTLSVGNRASVTKVGGKSQLKEIAPGELASREAQFIKLAWGRAPPPSLPYRPPLAGGKEATRKIGGWAAKPRNSVSGEASSPGNIPDYSLPTNELPA